MSSIATQNTKQFFFTFVSPSTPQNSHFGLKRPHGISRFKLSDHIESTILRNDRYIYG